jgi:lysophospholipase L1-like esterase
MTRTIVCFGDSNTHGEAPALVARHPRDVRWTGILRSVLGQGYEIIEEGLGGRTTVFDSPLAPGRSGRDYLLPCLWSHKPVDLVVIMLGTNDLKRIYGVTANEIAVGTGVLVDLARQSLAGPGDLPPAVLLVAPVPVGAATSRSEVWGFGAAAEESGRLASKMRIIAADRGVPFFEAGSVASVSPIDGVHLDAGAHRALGTALADVIRDVLGPP